MREKMRCHNITRIYSLNLSISQKWRIPTSVKGFEQIYQVFKKNILTFMRFDYAKMRDI